MNVLLGITGSIAAYKSLELVRSIKKKRNAVKVILTQSALHFVTPLSCQILSANEVYKDQFILTKGIKHLALSEWADVLVIAPATANIIGKAASGIGDNLLSTTILSFQKPILFVPAMDQGMWQNAIVQENVKYLRKSGYHFLEPGVGLLASGKIGKGRFPTTSIIYKKILSIFDRNKSLNNTKFLITGGRTEEDIDSVRVITNRSSGMMALELIEAVVCRDGHAKGIFGEVSVPLPEDIDIIRVRTSKEMLTSLKENTAWCDCLIMASAVGDYRPRSKNLTKVHSEKITCELEKNKDLLREMSKNKGDKVFVGFSLEDKNNLRRAKEKLVSKKLDIIVLNSVHAIGSENVTAQILKKKGRNIHIGDVTKSRLANKILDECIMELKRKKLSTKK